MPEREPAPEEFKAAIIELTTRIGGLIYYLESINFNQNVPNVIELDRDLSEIDENFIEVLERYGLYVRIFKRKSKARRKDERPLGIFETFSQLNLLYDQLVVLAEKAGVDLSGIDFEQLKKLEAARLAVETKNARISDLIDEMTNEGQSFRKIDKAVQKKTKDSIH